MFVTKDINVQKKEADELSNIVYDNIYIGTNKEDVIHFIEEVVLSGKDCKSACRKDIMNHYLLPPNGRFASENMYNDLCDSLNVKK